jgi:hypothetical protein
MVLLRDILISLWGSFVSLVAFFAEKTTEAGIDVDPLLIAILVVFLSVWLASGCWAGSIAGARRHPIRTNFALGILVPFFYPLFCLFFMDIKGAKERARSQKAEEEAAEAERQMREKAGQMETDEARVAGMRRGEPQMDAAYFKKIMLDDDGNPTGPWAIRFGETTVQARRICEVLQNAVVVEVGSGDGGEQRIRVPYAKISSCTPL